MGLLDELKKTSISVSDIASQYWCERQMEYNYRYGKKFVTQQVKDGKAMHAEMEEKVNIPIMLEPRSYPDSLFRNLYTSYMAVSMLNEKKKAREIQLYGSLNGYKIVGKLDQLELKEDEVVISDDKTRASPKIPSESQSLTHRIQLLIYRKMLDDIKQGLYSYDNFAVAYKADRMVLTPEFLRQLDALSVPKELQSIPAMAKRFFESVRSLGRLSETLVIRYIDQFTGSEIKIYKFQYDNEEVNGIIKHVLKYWNGERKALPVPEPEKWKCNYCVFFGKECTAWWPQQSLQPH